MRPHQLTAWSSLLFGKNIREYPSTFTDELGLRIVFRRLLNEPEFVSNCGGFGIARAQEEGDEQGEEELCFHRERTVRVSLSLCHEHRDQSTRSNIVSPTSPGCARR